MNIIKKMYRKYKGRKAEKILLKCKVLPVNSKKLYLDIKRGKIK